MKQILAIVLRLTAAFLLCAASTVMALNSNLGLSPWDVFHQGLTNVTSLTIGQASILVGVVIVLITSILGLPVGLGTIANMIVIGGFIDLIIWTKIIPVSTNLLVGVLMLIGSLFLNAIGTYLYIGCELGCGPRDGLMIILVKLTGKPIATIRFCIEMAAVTVGWILGGTVGIGTLMTVLGIGYCVQMVFKVLKFDVNSLKHKNIKQGFIFMSACLTHQSDSKMIP